MAPAAEAEIAALIMNACGILPLRATLEELGHPQPPTPMQTGSSTASGITNGIFKQDRSKAIGMRFYWLVGIVEQGQFNVYWDSGKKNLADYFTKHHPPSHHRRLRPACLHAKHSPSSLQGRAELLAPSAPALRTSAAAA